MTSIERYAKMKQEMQEIHDDWHKGFQDGRKATYTYSKSRGNLLE